MPWPHNDHYNQNYFNTLRVEIYGERMKLSRNLPTFSWFLCFKHHSKPHTNRDLRPIYRFTVFSQRNDKFWRACSIKRQKRKLCQEIDKRTLRGEGGKERKQQRWDIKAIKHTLDCRKLWMGFYWQQHEQLQQGHQCAYYQQIELMMVMLFVDDLHASHPPITGISHPLQL